MKEGDGDDHLAIAWQYPGQSREVIPARFSQVARFDGVQQTSFGAILDTWTNIGSGTTIADLDSGTNNLSNPPNMTQHLVGWLESPTSNNCESCGSRMKGWLVPPVTGNYEFWIASDNNGEFFLSTDNIYLQRQCHVPDFTSPREWTKYPEQKSSPIHLVAGQAYYYWVRIAVLSKHHVILPVVFAPPF